MAAVASTRSVEVHPDGTATMRAGTSAHGQGHQTSYAMLVSQRTGIPVESIRLVQSDTDLVRTGGGTGGSRSLQLGGSAVQQATDAMITKARSAGCAPARGRGRRHRRRPRTRPPWGWPVFRRGH